MSRPAATGGRAHDRTGRHAPYPRLVCGGRGRWIGPPGRHRMRWYRWASAVRSRPACNAGHDRPPGRPDPAPGPLVPTVTSHIGPVGRGPGTGQPRVESGVRRLASWPWRTIRTHGVRRRGPAKAGRWPRAGSLPAVRCPPTAVPCSARAIRSGRASTGTAGRTTRWCAPPMESTAPVPAPGWCTSRTASSPGSTRRPTTRRSARTARSTSRAAARAGPPSPGTPTRPAGSATPMSGASCSSCGARPASGSVTRSPPGPRSPATRPRPVRTSGPAARAGWCAPTGTR